MAIEPDLAVLSLARQLSVERPVGMFTNNPWLLKRHMAEVFPAVPDLFGTRAVFSAELGRSKPDPEAFRRLATRLECAPDRSSISTTMPPMWRAPGRPGCRPIASAEQQVCAPASPCMPRALVTVSLSFDARQSGMSGGALERRTVSAEACMQALGTGRSPASGQPKTRAEESSRRVKDLEP